MGYGLHKQNTVTGSSVAGTVQSYMGPPVQLLHTGILRTMRVKQDAQIHHGARRGLLHQGSAKMRPLRTRLLLLHDDMTGPFLLFCRVDKKCEVLTGPRVALGRVRLTPTPEQSEFVLTFPRRGDRAEDGKEDVIVCYVESKTEYEEWLMAFDGAIDLLRSGAVAQAQASRIYHFCHGLRGHDVLSEAENYVRGRSLQPAAAAVVAVRTGAAGQRALVWLNLLAPVVFIT